MCAFVCLSVCQTFGADRSTSGRSAEERTRQRQAGSLSAGRHNAAIEELPALCVLYRRLLHHVCTGLSVGPSTQGCDRRQGRLRQFPSAERAASQGVNGPRVQLGASDAPDVWRR